MKNKYLIIVLILLWAVNSFATVYVGPFSPDTAYINGSMAIVSPGAQYAMIGVYYYTNPVTDYSGVSATGEISKHSTVQWVDPSMTPPVSVNKPVTATMPLSEALMLSERKTGDLDKYPLVKNLLHKVDQVPIMTTEGALTVGQVVLTALGSATVTSIVIKQGGQNANGSWPYSFGNGTGGNGYSMAGMTTADVPINTTQGVASFYSVMTGGSGTGQILQAHKEIKVSYVTGVIAPTVARTAPEAVTALTGSPAAGSITNPAVQAELDAMFHDPNYVPKFTDESTGGSFSKPSSSSVATPAQVSALNAKQELVDNATSTGTASTSSTAAASAAAAAVASAAAAAAAADPTNAALQQAALTAAAQAAAVAQEAAIAAAARAATALQMKDLADAVAKSSTDAATAATAAAAAASAQLASQDAAAAVAAAANAAALAAASANAAAVLAAVNASGAAVRGSIDGLGALVQASGNAAAAASAAASAAGTANTASITAGLSAIKASIDAGTAATGAAAAAAGAASAAADSAAAAAAGAAGGAANVYDSDVIAPTEKGISGLLSDFASASPIVSMVRSFTITTTNSSGKILIGTVYGQELYFDFTKWEPVLSGCGGVLMIIMHGFAVLIVIRGW